MEREHILIFQDMLDEADKYEVPEAFAGEYGAYLQALVDSAVFTDDAVTSELATQSENDIAALELGINAEKDSILFYYEMREMMPKAARAKIDKVITEEKQHLRQLSELRNTLASGG
jgi:rubrerythrin